MKKFLALLSLWVLSFSGSAQTYMEMPSWFTYDPGVSFHRNCPTTFTMPDGHWFGCWFGHNKDATAAGLLAKGDTYTEYNIYNDLSNWQTGDPRFGKCILFLNDEWTRHPPVSTHPGGVGDWINTATEQQVIDAYVSKFGDGRFGGYLDDLEAYHDLNMNGAKGLRAALIEQRRRMIQNDNNRPVFGGWNTQWYLGQGTKEQKSAFYTASKAQILSSPSSYGFNALWADDLYPGSGQEPRRLIDGYTLAVNHPYMTGLFDRVIFQIIEASEATRKAFPEKQVLTFQWPVAELANTGGVGIAEGPVAFYQGPYRDKGFGTWAVNQGIFSYPAVDAFNMAVWGLAYGPFYLWNGNKFGDGSEEDARQQPIDYIHLAKYYWGGIPENRAILAASTEVEMLEWSDNNGSSWHTGSDLYPAYCKEAGNPIFRAKKSGDGSQAVFLGFWDAGHNGAVKNVLVRFPGQSKTYAFKASRWTQMARVNL